MTDRIRKGGSTEDTPQRTAPENPAERKPARTARLMAIAPGEDWLADLDDADLHQLLSLDEEQE